MARTASDLLRFQDVPSQDGEIRAKRTVPSVVPSTPQVDTLPVSSHVVSAPDLPALGFVSFNLEPCWCQAVTAEPPCSLAHRPAAGRYSSHTGFHGFHR